MNALRPNQYLSLFLVEFSAIMSAHPGQAALTIFYAIPLAFSLYLGYRHLYSGASFDAEKLKNAAAFVGLVLFLPALLGGHFFSGLLTMMAWLVIAMNIGLKARRELYFLLLGTFILFLYGTSVSMQNSFLFWIVLYTLSALMLLVHDNFNKILIHAAAKDVTESKQTAFILSGSVMTLATLIYLLLPRPDAINIGFLPAGGPQFYQQAGWKDEAANTAGAAPKEYGERPEPGVRNTEEGESQPSPSDQEAPPPSNNPAMSLEPDREPIPGSELLMVMKGKDPQYLRGYVFDYFSGTHWVARDNRYEKLQLKNQSIRFGAEQKPLHSYSVTFKKRGDQHHIIYVPLNTKRLDFPGSVIARNGYATLFAPEALKAETFYTAAIRPEWVKGHPVNTALTLLDKRRYLQLPKAFAPTIREVAKSLQDPESELESALKIEKHFRENFRYSQSTLYSDMQEGTLEHFMFVSRYGHCEYFATSMALMLRSIGIPARIVSGYSATTFNPVTGYYEVRAIDAHSWVEAYVDALGWVSFEPTPAYGLPAEKEEEAMTEMLKQYLNKLQEIEQLQEEATGLEQLQYSVIGIFGQINNAVHAFGEWLKRAIALFGVFMKDVGVYMMLSAFGVYALWYHFRIALWRFAAEYKIRRAVTKADFLQETYRALDVFCTRVGLAKAPYETLQEYSRRLSEVYPQQKKAIEGLLDAVHQASYSRDYRLPSVENSFDKAMQLLRLPVAQLPFGEHLLQSAKRLIS